MQRTPASEARRARAAELAASCPASLACEIAVTGSVAHGIADHDSDIELNFWAREMPSRADRERWLRSLGAEQIFPEIREPDGTAWTTFALNGVWIEAGWQTVAAQSQTLRQILAGRLLAHDRFIQAGVIWHALSLRSEGALESWRRSLARYPDEVRERIIAGNTSVWQMPHAVGGRWTLCRRGDEPALTQRLLWDFANVWSLLFALNRRWEPDRKWLRFAVAELALVPGRFAERVEQIFGPHPAQARVRTCMELILDTLALLPASEPVQRAAATVTMSLEAHPPDVRSG